MSDNVDLLKQIVTTVQKKNDKEQVNDTIKTKPAKVIGVDDETHKVFVYFLEDTEQKEYTFYNKSGEIISEGDTVKVFYTTNVAKGWIGARMGEPVCEKEIPPYISAKVINNNLVKHNRIQKNLISVDFTVNDNKSDVVFTGVHCCNNTTGGNIKYVYSVNGEEQDFSPEQTVSVGNYMIPHTYPMNLIVGQHNFAIDIKSEDSIGTTDIGKFLGEISGQISNVRLSQPVNNDLIFKFTNIPAGTELAVPMVNKTGFNWYVDWGDGSDVETIEGNQTGDVPVTHQYNSDGDYIMTISLPGATISFNDSYAQFIPYIENFRLYITSVIIPDKTTEIRTFNWLSEATNLSHFSLGRNIQYFEGSLYNTINLRTLQFPNTIKRIDCNFSRSGLVNFTMPSKCVLSSWSFSECLNLISAEINYTSATYYNFSNCENLESVIIHSGATEIDEFMFSSCGKLKNVDLTKASSLKSIGIGAFLYCYALEKIFIPDSVTSILSNSFEKDITIQGHEGSYAIEYAKTNGYNYEIV